MIDFLCVTTEGLARSTCGAAAALPQSGHARGRRCPTPAHRQNGSFPRPALPQNAGGWVFDPPRARREILLDRNPVRLGGILVGLRARISNVPPCRGPFWPRRAEAGAERARGGREERAGREREEPRRRKTEPAAQRKAGRRARGEPPRGMATRGRFTPRPRQRENGCRSSSWRG